jgi:hypothetical protein
MRELSLWEQLKDMGFEEHYHIYQWMTLVMLI